jgi:2-polyprenyl-3-methyl-5-hydroxy-6-metoxy-1,4-benzoquinol methylase
VLSRLRALLNLPARVDAQFGRLRHDVETGVHEVQRALKTHKDVASEVWERQRAEHASLEQELAATRDEMREQMQRFQLQLTRLAAVGDHSTAPQDASGMPIPMSVERAPAAPRPDAGDWQWLDVAACQGCGTVERTIVCEWNKAVLLDRDLPDEVMRYDYAMCHGCGIVYATRRPVGATYRTLMDDFEETIGRGAGVNAQDALLNPAPLSDADRERYRRLIAAGVFVSDHESREHIEGLYKDRLDNAAHVELIANLLDLTRARVLEVRSRAGTILDGLRRQFGASVAAMPIFEGQQFILREMHGIECSDLIDYDRFTIPFDGTFDLIVCNHMLTHIVRVDRFFDEIRRHLTPGGHLYLYNEIDEDEFLVRGKSLVNTLNPIHLQVFDRSSLLRLLKANGFEVTFVKLRNGALLCLAKYTGQAARVPMPEEERQRRLRSYAQARAYSILRASDAVRPRFADVWDSALEQAVAAGFARFDDKGRLRLTKY